MNVFASRVNEISSISSSSYIINSLDVTTAFVGNVFTTRHHKLALFGLALWIVDIFLNFSFDFYEAHKMYGFAWGTVKVAEWLVFCTGSYFVIFKTVPWMKEGLRKLEKDNHAINYGKSMFKITISVKVSVLVMIHSYIYHPYSNSQSVRRPSNQPTNYFSSFPAIEPLSSRFCNHRRYRPIPHHKIRW